MNSPTHAINDASSYFNANWQKYQETLRHNMLYHREMMEHLSAFLDTSVIANPFSLVDVGCGDCSIIAPLLMKRPIKQYIGIDAAPEVLKLAANTLSLLPCDKCFIDEDMTTAIPSLPSTYDVIFTSYAVHHLSYQQKVDFIQACQDKLNPNGFLLMIDGVREKQQTRKEWLDILQARMQATIPDISTDELNLRMQHPRADDYPENINTFQKIASAQDWQAFHVLMQNNLVGFMVFTKNV